MGCISLSLNIYIIFSYSLFITITSLQKNVKCTYADTLLFFYNFQRGLLFNTPHTSSPQHTGPTGRRH